jgi:peroxiredoxin
VGLADRAAERPVLLAFFKVTCPTCQFAAPYLERLAQSGRITLLGVSQDNEEKTTRFNQTFGVTFETLIDPAAERYAVSRAYQLTNVPTLYLVEPGDRRITLASHGFSEADFEALAARADVEVFAPDEVVPAFKPG